jgi:hypothetical protein
MSENLVRKSKLRHSLKLLSTVGIIAVGVYCSLTRLSEQFSYDLLTRGREAAWMLLEMALTIFLCKNSFKRSPDSSVSIVTIYELDGHSSIPGRGKRLFSTPQRPDRFWGPPSLLSNGYPGMFLQVKLVGA